MYGDSAYIGKHNVPEPNSAAVRETPFPPVDDGMLRYCFPTTHSALSAAPIMKGFSIPPALHPVSCTT